MTRRIDWTPLASSDPVAGDPLEITAIARRHGELAAELRTQAANLRTMASSGGWDADAGRLFTASAADIAVQFDAAEQRYTAVAEALSGYAPYLEQAQREADAAWTQAQEAQARIDATTQAPSPTPTPAPMPVGPVLPNPYAPVPGPTVGDLEQAHEELRLARQRLHRAEDLRTDQARRAANHIQSAAELGGLVDSWWDKVKDWSSDRWAELMDWTRHHASFLKKLAQWCGRISLALSILAIVLSFTPLAPAVPFLLAASQVFNAVALGAHLLLALSGEGGWLDVGLDVISAVSAGYGKVAGKVAGKSLEGSQDLLRKVAKRAIRKTSEKAMSKGLHAGGRAVRPLGKKAAKASAARLRARATGYATEQVEAAAKAPLRLRDVRLRDVRLLDGDRARAAAEARKLTSLVNNQRVAAAAAEVQEHLRQEAAEQGRELLFEIGKQVREEIGGEEFDHAVTFGRYR